MVGDGWAMHHYRNETYDNVALPGAASAGGIKARGSNRMAETQVSQPPSSTRPPPRNPSSTPTTLVVEKEKRGIALTDPSRLPNNNNNRRIEKERGGAREKEAATPSPRLGQNFTYVTPNVTPRDIGLSTSMLSTSVGLGGVPNVIKVVIADQPLHRCGRYCYGFAVLQDGQRLVYVLKLPPQWIFRMKSSNRSLSPSNWPQFKVIVTTRVLNEEEESKRRDSKGFKEALRLSDTDYANIPYTDRTGHPVYKIREDGESIEVTFKVSPEEASLPSIFLYQFFLKQGEAGDEIFRAQSVPIMVTEVQMVDKALYLLICHVFKRKKDFTPKELKRLFKLLTTKVEYAKRCFKSHPWESNKIDGRNLNDILFWFTKCCETFKACPILFEYNIMYGYLSRARTEEILGAGEEGAFLLRIGSGEVGGLVMSTRMTGKYVHVTISPPSDMEVLKQLNVPTLKKVLCYDSTPLPKQNLIGLYKAHGKRLS